MDWILLIEHYPSLLYGSVALFSLAVGSFLNVVIYRLPRMLEYGWRQECAALTGKEAAVPPGPRLSLAYLPSHCLHCGHRIWALENIPLVSYLVLHGRCSSYGGAIDLRYPLVEIGTALLSVLVVWRSVSVGRVPPPWS